ncbi:unnamed protein product, partial [Anisakis simplex]|uniref:Putative ATPase (inferred by orthology to a S. mansoni protein) n=1 Tax=Anisakis simplex TaxID=6269 RepID=A0A0M3JPU1_ANISI
MPPPDFAGAPGAAQGGDEDQGGDGSRARAGQVGTRMAYSFDSTALERAAKAAKELEKFPNAKEALELSRMQEVTRQKEVEAQTKASSVFGLLL